jgi:hypothetical protein
VKMKNIIYTTDYGYLHWVIWVELGWAGFKNLNLHSTCDIHLLDFLIHYHP